MDLAMVAGMTPRARVVLLVVAPLVAIAGLLVVDAGGRGRSMRCLPRRLGDVGDSWRALLLGAPPLLP